MRRHALFLAAAVMAGCAAEPPPRLPPANRFYFPTGIAHADVPGTTGGALYVASSNFDKCYDYGQLTAISLDAVGLPDLQPLESYQGVRPQPRELTDFTVAETGRRLLQSYTGEMAAWSRPTGGTRLFIPSRAEGSPLQAVDAAGTTLTCVGDQASDNCFHAAPSLDVAPAGGVDGLPAAPAPIGVTVGSMGGYGQDKVFVTHMEGAVRLSDDSQQPEQFFFMVATSAAEPALSTEAFVPVATATQSVAVGKRYAYVTAQGVQSGGPLLQLVDLHPERGSTVVDGRKVYRAPQFALGRSYLATQARGVALSPDEKRLYLAIRGMGLDVLLVANITGAEEDVPSVRVVNEVPLAPGADQVRVIPRANGNLVVVTSAGDPTDPSRQGSVTIYDDGLGQVVAELANIGKQPYGVTVDLRETAGVSQARIFVSLFGEGRVAVLDMPDVRRPDFTVPVAYLGSRQIDSNKAGRQSAVCGVGE